MVLYEGVVREVVGVVSYRSTIRFTDFSGGYSTEEQRTREPYCNINDLNKLYVVLITGL